MAFKARFCTLGLTKIRKSDAKMSFLAKDIDCLWNWDADLLAVGVTEKDMKRFKDNSFKNNLLNKLDAHMNGLLSRSSFKEGFSGKPGQSTLMISIHGPGLSSRVTLIGLGVASAATCYRNLGEDVAAAATSTNSTSVAVALASYKKEPREWNVLSASSIAIGATLGAFNDERFKSEPKKATIQSVDILGFGTGAEIEDRLKYADHVSSGVIFAKELVNSPANVLISGVLAEEARNVALEVEHSDVLTVKILEEKQCKELKMGLLLAVGAASCNPPFLIHVCYRPPRGVVRKKVALVGKGITFDSGGYNMKIGSDSMIQLMKTDMGGSGAILGAAKAIGQIKPSGVEVHFIVAAAENLISGTGMRPGDILTASNGKTVEVNDTDSKGRLVLADALVYACKQGVEKIIDLATLTGDCVVGLGPSIAGIFTHSEDLAEEFLKASKSQGEKMWRLPLEQGYLNSLKSRIADLVNSAGPNDSQVISAAVFLNQFVDDKVQWLHVDMFGPVWDEITKSATGFGVATLVEWVMLNSSIVEAIGDSSQLVGSAKGLSTAEVPTGAGGLGYGTPKTHI